MKTAVYFKHFLSAFAALSLLCIASSCRDQDFDWDKAHATEQYQKFTDVFIKEFGKPAPGHQWGFDVPWQTSQTRATRADERMTYKLAYENMDVIMQYGMVPNILDNENWEVLEWFSRHKVEWTNQTHVVGRYFDAIENCVHTFPDEYKDKPSCHLLNSSKVEVKLNANYENGKKKFTDASSVIDNGYVVKEIYYKEDNSNEIDEARTLVDNNILDKGGSYLINKGDGTAIGPVIVKMVTFDKKYESTRQTKDGIAHLVEGYNKENKYGLSADNSLLQYTPEYWLDSPHIGTNIDFKYAWFQSVANYDKNETMRIKEGGAKNIHSVTKEPDDIDHRFSDWSDASSSQMDEVYIYSSGIGEHGLDWNNGQGYGYANQNNQTINYNGKNLSLPMNGTLAVGFNLNNITYGSSNGSSARIDKWIIVYLKGDGYEGWYLGFDLEAGGNNPSEMVEPNGYCNDWIVKLTSVDYSENDYSTRLMCEDLGADVSKNSSDIDYNDIVLDVDYRLYKGVDNISGVTMPTKAALSITPKAAGGTLPLIVGYQDKTEGNNYSNNLFEVHEYLKSGNKSFYDEGHKQSELSFYVDMLNTNAPDNDEDHKDLKGNGDAVLTAPAFTMSFFGIGPISDNNVNSINNHSLEISATPPTSIENLLKQNIFIKVYRLSPEDYISTPSAESEEAAWWLLDNGSEIQAGAPAKICVPQTVNWLRERHKISDGYKNFSGWVSNVNNYFWTSDKTIDHKQLHNEQ